MFNKNDVIQFNENHKWCGCLGIISEAKRIENDVRYLIGVPIPESGAAYIFSLESKHEIEKIGGDNYF